MKITHLAAAFAVSALFTTAMAESAAAQAATCKRGGEYVSAADPHAAVFEIEGPITAYDRAARTLTAVGATVTIPEGLLFDTGPLQVTWEQLTDPTAELTRSIVGGTVAVGGGVADLNGDGCADLIPDAAHFTFREDVLLGVLPLESVDVAGGAVWVDGTKSVVDLDPRTPGALLDASGNPDIGWEDLAGFEGRPMSIEGFLQNGAIQAWAIETPAYKVNPAPLDNVIIGQGRWYPDKLEVKLVGYVEPRGATYVDIYTGGDVVVDPITGAQSCAGTYRGRIPTQPDPDIATQARFVFSSGEGNDPVDPQIGCIVSEGGDANRRTLIPWRRLPRDAEPVVAAPTGQE